MKKILNIEDYVNSPDLTLTLAWSELSYKINHVHLLDSVSGEMQAGQLFGICGPSGSSKTILLKCIYKKIQNTCVGNIRGDVFINKNRCPNGLVGFHGKIAYVPQEDVVLWDLSVEEYLLYAAKLRNSDANTNDTLLRVNDILQTMKIGGCKHTKIRFLSGGERKRCCIAIELLADPLFLLIDEGTSGLDSAIAASIVLTLKELSLRKSIVIGMSIHQPSSRVVNMFSTILMLSRGRVAYTGSPDCIREYLISLHYLPPPLGSNLVEFFIEMLVYWDPYGSCNAWLTMNAEAKRLYNPEVPQALATDSYKKYQAKVNEISAILKYLLQCRVLLQRCSRGIAASSQFELVCVTQCVVIAIL
jgi:ABC-type multidrug transport system ATPase subunit